MRAWHEEVIEVSDILFVRVDAAVSRAVHGRPLDLEALLAQQFRAGELHDRRPFRTDTHGAPAAAGQRLERVPRDVSQEMDRKLRVPVRAAVLVAERRAIARRKASRQRGLSADPTGWRACAPPSNSARCSMTRWPALRRERASHASSPEVSSAAEASRACASITTERTQQTVGRRRRERRRGGSAPGPGLARGAMIRSCRAMAAHPQSSPGPEERPAPRRNESSVFG